MIRWLAVLLMLLPGSAFALDFSLPATARLTVERNSGPDIYNAPAGVFADGAVPVLRVEGDVRRAAWRLEAPGLTTFQVMRPLRTQLEGAGFEIILDCAQDSCGGFDFRFATETLPGPHMYVNIRAYHVVTGKKQTGGAVQEVVTLLASTSANSAYVQIIRAGALDSGGATVQTTAPRSSAAVPLNSEDLVAQLETKGHVVLSDLDFGTGSTELGPGPFQSLTDIAAYLQATPDMRIALVGHTDTVGGLQTNIAISRDRARSVRQRLINGYGISGERLDAEGMGYLSPLANNLNAAGRHQNRRVEVVLLGP